ncbi:hypothetical protein [Sessilibacter corallicola]|uniref:hypothetical protein n=1 Tax=Sessilibacter corallicola TaxID=2904075 RepID=UPI001E446EED|nr:hypothetical protein [Sessilibacter corallicola]MCE2029255.1 hypothetical protein [Sessilibacter corallicola]
MNQKKDIEIKFQVTEDQFKFLKRSIGDIETLASAARRGMLKEAALLAGVSSQIESSNNSTEMCKLSA